MKPGARYLIMTHSHALDFDIVEAILARGDARFIGLIGSATKRAQFEARLRDRGFSEQAILSVTCPIGVTGVTSKHPGAIATSVVAQLLQQTSREGLQLSRATALRSVAD